jgi:hypothetical protein
MAKSREGAVCAALVLGVSLVLGSVAGAEAPASHFEVGLSGLVLIADTEQEDGAAETEVTGGAMLHLGLLVQLGDGLWQLGPLARAGLAGDGIASLEVEARRHVALGGGLYLSPLLGLGVLFGPGSSSDDLLPSPDVTAHAGVGLDAAVGESTRVVLLLRYTQAFTDAYYGPLDLTVGLAWGL